MNDVVNLRQFKKRKARADREQTAAQNRAVHGRTKVEKNFETRAADRVTHFLDANRLERDPDEKS